MVGPFGSWFDAQALYARGIPDVVTTALQAFPRLHARVQELAAASAPRRSLEVGPGERPVLEGLAGACFLDLAPVFLQPLAGLRVQGDLLRAPFRDGAFDLVVANDVFTHIRPDRRPTALAELVRLAPRVLLFNPEPGTPEVQGSAVPTAALVERLDAHGYAVAIREDFRARVGGRLDFTMSIVLAARRGAGPRLVTSG